MFKSTINATRRRHCFPNGDIMVNFELISHYFLMFLLLTLNGEIFAAVDLKNIISMRLEYDSNGDGIITHKEFVANSQHDPNYETIEDVHRQFESYDRDEDGSLSIQEIQIASREMQPLNEVRQEIDTIFKTLDKYKHDYLTYDELAESHQFFTDKDVTLPDTGGDEDYEHDEL